MPGPKSRPSSSVTRGKAAKRSGAGGTPEEQPAVEPIDLTPMVSEVIGTGADAHRLVQVGPWRFSAPGVTGEEVVIRDADLGARIGLARPRDVRKLVERIWPENKRPIHRATVARWIAGKGSQREAAVQEYWLTEAQALKLIARSETKVAEAILDEMIAVYMAARRGLLRPAAATAPSPEVSTERVLGMVGAVLEQMRAGQEVVLRQVEATSTAVAAVAARLTSVESELASGVVGPTRGAEIRARLRGAAQVAGCGDRKAAASFRSAWDQLARNGAQFVGKRTSWGLLPRAKLATVEAFLDTAEREARRRRDLHLAAAEGAAKGKQQELPLKPN